MKRLLLIFVFVSSVVFAGGKLQDADFKTEAELITAGATKTSLLNDTKIYVSGSGINKTLDQAIIDGDIGGGGGSSIIPTIQKLTSGTGATYTTPAGVLYIRVRMVGGGGGGSGGGTSAGTGALGGTTTFGTLSCGGGSSGGAGGPSQLGGTATIGAGFVGVTQRGGATIGTCYGTNGCQGGNGGISPFGGNGGGSWSTSNGSAALANSGSGGGGGGANSNLFNGHGGSAGGYLDAITTGTPNATYTYTIGSAGGGGSPGTGGGAGGLAGTGFIVVYEYRQ